MRMTRAALRAQESEETLRDRLDLQLKKQAVVDPLEHIMIHEDSDKENSVVIESEAKSLESEQIGRKVLKDITDETYPNIEMAESQQLKQTATKKGKKKGKGKPQQDHASGVVAEVSMDATKDNINVGSHECEPSTPIHSSTSEKELSQKQHMSQSTAGILHERSASNSTIATVTDRSTPPEDDLFSDGKMPVSITMPPRFDPDKHLDVQIGSTEVQYDSKDSFVENITSRSPSKHDTSDSEATDSFKKDITSRAPTHSVSSPRVEDHVTALDALEDAIEKIAEDLPALESIAAASPTKRKSVAPRSPLKVTVKTTAKGPQKPLSPVKAKMTAASLTSSAGKLSVKDRIKAFETKPQAPSHRRAASVVATKSASTASVKAPKKPAHAPSKSVTVAPSKPMISPAQSPTKPKQNMVKKRVPSGPLSTSKPGFVPTKSTKPLTKSAFTLPGDAVAAKLKAQREERAKKEEEIAGKKKDFKARPAPVKTAGPSVVPRENKTSQARMKRLSGEDKENVEPAKSSVPKAMLTTNKTRPSKVQPNSSVRRTSPPALSNTVSAKSNTNVKRITSNQSTISQASQTSSLKAGANSKEAFDRRRMTIAEVQREKKNKEEAARKARAEAAERGRQASRDWAEKQKRRLQAEKEAKTKVLEPAIVA